MQDKWISFVTFFFLTPRNCVKISGKEFNTVQPTNTQKSDAPSRTGHIYSPNTLEAKEAESIRSKNSRQAWVIQWEFLFIMSVLIMINIALPPHLFWQKTPLTFWYITLGNFAYDLQKKLFSLYFNMKIQHVLAKTTCSNQKHATNILSNFYSTKCSKIHFHKISATLSICLPMLHGIHFGLILHCFEELFLLFYCSMKNMSHMSDNNLIRQCDTMKSKYRYQC